jgi:outer membrane receptor protein involved in Fe transport
VKKVTTEGVEVEAFLAVGDGVFLSAGGTFANAKYGENLEPNNSAVEGKRLTQSPEWQSTAALFIDREFPGSDNLRRTFNLNWAHIGKVNTGSDLDPEKVRDAFNLFNAQAGIGTADGRYEIRLWGKNLTNKRMNTLVFDSVFQAGSWHTFLNEPRMWGVTAKTNF